LKKILYILDTFETGGAEKSLLDIAMHNRAVISVFVTLYQGNQLAATAQKAGIKVIALNRKEKYAFGKITQLLLPIIKEEQPDLIHATLFRADIVARKLKKYFSIPLVSSLVNNSYVAERYQKLSFVGKLKLYYIQQLDAKTAKKVDFFVSNSQTIKDSNAKALHLNLDKIKVIYRGRALSKFTSVTTQQIEETKNALGLHPQTFVLLNVSRLLDRKGQLDLLKAIKELRKTVHSFKLFIAGEGFYRSVLEHYIQEHDLVDHVTLLGNRSDVPVLLQIADAFVFPSHYEGLPGALIEAMMAEKTIICSDIPENMECVSNQEALIFQKGNIIQLTETIEKVVKEPEQFKALGEKAKHTAIEKFSIDKVVEQYTSFYHSIILNHQP
jgi:glycosyltransferase involved in cell wall biosynthesis